ncbi:SIR2 family protein [Pectobacterium brasiliense]|uniref:P-loop NTPase n=1 Tax=Pectobacterium TaxID=122277 RepID=UPI00293C1363|nr:SIR2 family protein [Pectobacterium sp. HCp5_1]
MIKSREKESFMEIESKNTFERCLREGINVFTGAGFSVLSFDKNETPLPVGDELRIELIKKFPGSPSTLKLPQLCTLISRSKRDDLNDYIRSRFEVRGFSDKYKNLASVNIKNIFTTNVDNLVESIFKGNPKKYINNTTFNGVSFREKSAIDYFYLHGSVCDTESPLIFGDLDIANAFSNDPTKWNYLKSIMNKFPTLFWGYALKDAGTLQVFADSLDDQNRKNSWIIIHPDYIDEGEIEYYQSLELKIILSDTETFLDYLASFEEPKDNQEIFNQHENPFPEYSIPSHSDIERRSINDFYQGANPSWSDIYSSRVNKLHYYSIVEEYINGGKNVLITGGPATGKSTLLMQMAAFHNFNGIKLFLSDISSSKAETLSARIKNTPTILFVDNMQTSMEALNNLSAKKNIKMVIAERDYAYLSASRANFLRRNVEIIDITQLTEPDAQGIIDNIPADLKKNKKFNLREGDSLFELIEHNCRTPSIKERFKNVLKELHKKDKRLVQLFLLVCYMHNSRSVTSMDILYSYFREESINPQEIYSLIDILSSCLSEYAGEYSDSDQDYFSIRSNLLSEHISTIAPEKDLACMLTNFHMNVSRYCIPNYDSFKRRAYDARLFERAFPQTETGEKIYDIIYRKHNSPFNLQQKALYLSRRGNHERAFIVIDEAIANSGSGNWSVKNSYAIIKFKANINRNNSYDVRKALNESMESLEQCYTADMRKAFHAMSYADQSLKYWKKYRDQTAKGYLEKSKEWLGEEANKDNSIRNVSRLLQQINNVLR